MKKIKLTESELISLITTIISEQESSDLYQVLKQKYGFLDSNNGVKLRQVKKLSYYDKESNSDKKGSYVVEIELYEDSKGQNVSFLFFIPPEYEKFESLMDEVLSTLPKLGAKIIDGQDGQYRDGFFQRIIYNGGELNNDTFINLIAKIKNSFK